MRCWPILACLWGAACASSGLIPIEQRSAIQRELAGRVQPQFLKLSFYVAPFFGDGAKRLLTPSFPTGEPEGVVSAGQKARILKVEFPNAFARGRRGADTPRTQPWVYLALDGQSPDKPFILVLRPLLGTEHEFMAELDRYLTSEDPTSRIDAWPELVRSAIRSKTAVLDMPAEALEMAWGYPEVKKRSVVDSVKKEEWRYADGKRTAFLAEGRVIGLEPSF